MSIQRFTVLSETPIQALNAPHTGEWVKYADHKKTLAALRDEVLEEAALACGPYCDCREDIRNLKGGSHGT
jgi:hypothetical protein